MHFFTDPTALVDQPSSGAYGPVSTDAQNKFNVSSAFTVATNTKVFACQDSMMVVQPFAGDVNDPRVNIILKPLTGLSISFNPVKYYLYRGVAKNSLISGTAIVPNSGTDKTEFISKFWTKWNEFKTNNSLPNLPDPTPQSFGFDATLAGTVMIDELFNSAQSNNTVINDLQAIRVMEGEWIGNFLTTHEFNVEIITDTDHLTIDLDYVRKAKHIVDVTALTGVTPSTPQNDFLLKTAREKILNYIDPAAFFGMHYAVGVLLSTYPGGTKTTQPKKEGAIYTDILTKFFTRNRIYIDIRSEKGYSYNYYQNYGVSNQLLKIKPQPVTTFVTSAYATSGWPVYYDDQPLNSKFIQVQLRVDDNLKPLLFFENAQLLGKTNKNNFVTETNLRNGTAVDWTKTIKLEIPNYVSGTSQTNIAHHIRMQYFRQSEPAGTPTNVFKNTIYLDAVFGGIHLPGITIPSVFNNIKNNKRGFIKGSNFSYVADNGIYYDTARVVLYATKGISLKASKIVYPKINFSPFSSAAIVSNPVLPRHIIYNKWVVNDSTGTINILQIAAFNNTDKNTTPVEDVFFLGLTRAELTALDTISGASDLHHKYIAFEEIPNQADVITGTAYKKFKLSIRALNNVREVVPLSPSPDIFVYGSGLNMLCSKDFAAGVPLPDNLPDPGDFKEWPYVKKVSYNKSHSIVTSHPLPAISSGLVEVNDKGNEYMDNKVQVELRAELYFPADADPATLPDDGISSRKTSYPITVIVHGNGQSYTDYDALSYHLAYNGFIVLSIDCRITRAEVNLTSFSDPAYPSYNYTFEYRGNQFYYHSTTHVLDVYSLITPGSLLSPTGLVYGTDFDHTITTTVKKFVFLRDAAAGPKGNDMASLGRANIIYPHLQLIKNHFGTKVEDNIGIIGHSRGGEGVLRAAKDILTSTAPSTLKTVKAIISLAPTDAFDDESLIRNIPYFVLYGSFDGDVSGRTIFPRQTGEKKFRGSGSFSLLDKAINTSQKAMAFVYRATHNGFITDNRDYRDLSVSLEFAATQATVTKAYMNAFLRWHLKAEPIWKPVFEGNYIPPSVTTRKIYTQYRNLATGRLVVQEFNALSSVPSGTAAGQISHSTGFTLAITEFNRIATNVTVSPPTENLAKRLDKYSPHYFKGLYVTYPAAGGSVHFHLNPAGVNVTNYTFISFRVSHSVDLTLFAYPDLAKLKVGLTDFATHSFESQITKKIPEPDRRRDTIFPIGGWVDSSDLTKSALITIRIPLSDYSIGGVDLTKIKQVSIVFPTTTSGGKVDVDDIEFSN